MPRKSSLSGSRERGEVEAAVASELEALGVGGSGTWALALALAREVDQPGNSATSKSMCAKALMDALEKLRAVAPPVEASDGIDELSKRRSARVANT